MSLEPTSTFGRPHRTLSMRAFNGLGRLLRRCGLRRPLCAERILAGACRRADRNDFGELDVREPLERLVDSLEQDNRLTPLGRLLLGNQLEGFAVARLGVVAALKEHPEILKEQISRPLFVLGLHRTGSTLLHRLLAADSAGRALALWELNQPGPTPPAEKDRRIRETRRRIALFTGRLVPGFQSLHPMDAEAPEECFPLLMNTFRSLTFNHYGSIRSYREWLVGLGDANTLRVYEEYHSQLQLRQWGCPPRRWVLKAPVHAYGLAALLRLFPDACVVQTHRALAEVLPSLCSLRLLEHGLYSDNPDPHRIAAEAAKHVNDLLDAARRAREAHPGRVHDVSYRDLVSDPLGTARSIYERFDLPWASETEAGMRAWLAANPQGKHGRHRYSLEQFGLDRAAVDRLFPDYPECFGLPAFGEDRQCKERA
jgi:hypothetical protein